MGSPIRRLLSPISKKNWSSEEVKGAGLEIKICPRLPEANVASAPSRQHGTEVFCTGMTRRRYAGEDGQEKVSDTFSCPVYCSHKGT